MNREKYFEGLWVFSGKALYFYVTEGLLFVRLPYGLLFCLINNLRRIALWQTGFIISCRCPFKGTAAASPCFPQSPEPPWHQQSHVAIHLNIMLAFNF